MPGAILSGTEPTHQGLFQRIVDWLFGYDFFISYSHGDGMGYPQRLKQRLERSGFRVFLDQTDYVAGTNLSRETGRQVRKSNCIVVIGRPNALKSIWVKREVDLALKSGKDPIVIDINNSVSGATSGDGIVQTVIQQDWLRLHEQLSDTDGVPSDRTVSELIRGFKHTKQETLRTRFMAFAATLFAMVALAAVVEAVVARQQERKALDAHVKLLTEKAEALALTTGDATGAMLVALEGLMGRGDETTRVAAAKAVYSGLYTRREMAVLSVRAPTAIAASPNGNLFAVGTVAGDIKVFSTRGELRASMTRSGTITDLAFHPDSTRLLSVSKDGTAQQWNFASGELTPGSMRHDGAILRARYDRTGQRIITAGDDKLAKVWDAERGQVLRELQHEKRVQDAVFSPGGQHIATMSDHVVWLWDAGDGVLPRRFENAQAVAFDEAGTRIAVAGDFQNSGRPPNLSIWNLQTGQSKVLSGHGDKILGVMFSPDQSRLLSNSADGTARLWDADTGQPIGLPMRHASWVTAAQFNRDGSQILTSSPDNTAKLWDGQTTEPRAVLSGHHTWQKDGLVATFDASGDTVITASWDDSVRLWRTADGGGSKLLGPVKAAVLTAVFSRDGALVATGDSKGTAQLWNVKTGAIVRSLAVGEENVWAVAFSPDGSMLATASEVVQGKGGTLNVWALTDAREPAQPVRSLRFDRGLRTIDFSPDGRSIVTGGYAGIAKVLNVQTLTDISPPLVHEEPAQDEHWVQSAVFSPTGDRILTASKDGRIRIWMTSDWSLQSWIAHGGSRVFSASFDRDGRRIVSSSEGGQVSIWEPVESGGYNERPLFMPESEKSEVWTAVFSPDEKSILTPSFDKTARITSVPRSGADVPPIVAVLRGHTHWVRSAAFSPDGRLIVTASQDGTARIWPFFPDASDLKRHAIAIVPRCLHEKERRQLALDPQPPAWCLSGSKSQPKWPFDPPARKQ